MEITTAVWDGMAGTLLGNALTLWWLWGAWQSRKDEAKDERLAMGEKKHRLRVLLALAIPPLVVLYCFWISGSR